MVWQNGTRWQIELLRDDGTRIKTITKTAGFKLTSVCNNYGRFEITLPGEFDKALIERDRRIRFWRKPEGGSWYIEFEGLIRKWVYPTDGRGNLTRVVSGLSLEYILSGRVVAALAGASGADKTDYADDLMKAYVSEQLSTSGTASRNISTDYLTLQANASLGPSLTKACSYRNLLDVLRDLAESARQAGTEVYFFIQPGVGAFQFRTAVGQPGRDRTTGNQLIFGLARKNLREPVYTEDWTGEYNYAYALGPGQGTARTVTTASDDRGTESIFALREAVTQHNQAAGGAEAANAKVTQGRPVKTFAGKLLSRPGSVYGKDWHKFDRVNVDYDGMQFESLVRSVTVSVNGRGAEDLAAYAEAYV